MSANVAATGMGSGVVTAWIWNGFVAPATGVAMPAEVSAAIGPLVMALIERFMR